MKARWTCLWLTLLYVGFASTYSAGQESEERDESRAKLTLLVPAYSYPAENGLRFWDALIAVADRVPIVAIANPASGPGTKRDENYSTVLERAKRAGIRLIGYVTTGYAKRGIAEVNSDVDRWTTLYPMIEGIFFDEQSSEGAHVEHYAALSKHARSKIPNAFLVSNPGTICAKEFVASQAFDVICVFEGGQGYDSFQMPDWGVPTGRTQFATLLHGNVEADTAQRYLQQSASKGISHIYVTHDSLPNPWDELVSYWEHEVAIVRQINATGPQGASRK